ncbi:hypothetical protein D3C76_1362620 [compost metagenome]
MYSRQYRNTRGIQTGMVLGNCAHALIHQISYLFHIVGTAANQFIGSPVDLYGDACTIRCSHSCALLQVCMLILSCNHKKVTSIL